MKTPANKNELKGRLNNHGFLFTDANEVVLMGDAALLFDEWGRRLSGLFAEYKPVLIRTPLFFGEGDTRDSGYLGHFPSQLYLVRPFRAKGASTPRSFISPAACLHCYPMLKNTILQKTQSYLVSARCGRYENNLHQFPFRASGFHMLEFVMLGKAERLSDPRLKIKKLIEKEFARHNISGDFAVATDAFFLGESEGAKVMQKLKGLKEEFQLLFDRERVALASINNHESYFAERFGIRTAPKQVASSFCVAFGLERIVAASILTWKNDKIANFIH